MHDPVRTLPVVARLTYTWDGWPRQDGGRLPAEPPDMAALRGAWEGDGLRLEGVKWSEGMAQLVFEAEPLVSPVIFAGRVKGRLDHALRSGGAGWAGFSRKVGVRTIGANTDGVVERYLARQQVRGELFDPRYRKSLEEFSGDFPAVDLAEPTATTSGRYWYNLHVVAVTRERYRMGREDFLPKLSAAIPAWACGLGFGLRRFALMPDHVHVAARCDPALPPSEVAWGFLRAINRAAGCGLFSERVYVGTFSGYSRAVIGH